MRFFIVAIACFSIIGCSSNPPEPIQPKGDMIKINRFNPVTGEVIK